ncbi:T9SS type A sorting domain-containing protein [Epilithonimonas hungarica]|uniref:Por secretion system C-terminal sorting domain-containing protein n=1 Tax=Epilithonimonas hungarica TaxID=454006 RepID=A0A1G7FIL2_9FLAO|nr:T9SS type A sorting domain-containing protein [Epilithonimonas hungarica]SDE75692.1 Por secretion system C-terminal sorting domain-containing protein [Epilithonimonas hungarica]
MYKIKSIFSTIVLLLMFIHTKAQFSGSGNGTEQEPYQISNAAQLDEVRNFLGQTNSDIHFIMMNDIDLTSLIAEKYPVLGWEPIGSSDDLETSAFYGSLQGNGFTIKNLWISRTETDYLGLFGVTKDAIVNNLNIQLSATGITGGNYVGILAGQSEGGNITNVKTSGTITALSYLGGLLGSSADNTMIQNNSADVIINATGSYIGGLIGESASPVTNCHSSGEVNVDGDYSGGLIGKTSAGIANCSSTSNVTNTGGAFVGNFMGGLIGVNQASVNNSNASGDVTGISTIGGLVGDSYAPISNSYATGNITGRMWVGGLVGASDSVASSYATGIVYADQKIGGGLVGQSYGTITGSHASGFVSGSQSLGGLVGVMGGTVSFSYATGNVTQIVSDNTPEGGYVDIGGLAGSSFSNSFIENCFASGNVAVTDDTAMYVGGLIGLSNGISNSYAYGTVTGGYSLVGGLAGSTWEPIVNSAALNPWIKSSSTGNLNKIHRLVGDVEFETEIINSYALDTMLVNDQTITDGTENDWSGENRSVEEFQKQLTYGNGLNWDFENIWKIRETHGYPYLQSSEYLTSIISSDINNKTWGTISPIGIVAVNDGSSKTFEFSPADGYEIESVLVDNENIGKPINYTFPNVTKNHTVMVIFKLKQLSTNEIKNKNITVYPNPTADYIYVSGNKKITSLELYNSNGQKVLKTSESKMDLAPVTAGVYILKIVTENGEISSSKIIKK